MLIGIITASKTNQSNVSWQHLPGMILSLFSLAGFYFLRMHSCFLIRPGEEVHQWRIEPNHRRDTYSRCSRGHGTSNFVYNFSSKRVLMLCFFLPQLVGPDSAETQLGTAHSLSWQKGPNSVPLLVGL